MKNYVKIFMVVSFFNTHFTKLEASFLEMYKKRAMSHNNAEEISLSSEENKKLRDALIAVAHEVHRDIWEQEPLSNYNNPDSWDMVLMCVKGSDLHKGLLISKNIQDCENPNYALTVNVHEELQKDIKN